MIIKFVFLLLSVMLMFIIWRLWYQSGFLDSGALNREEKDENSPEYSDYDATNENFNPLAYSGYEVKTSQDEKPLLYVTVMEDYSKDIK